MARAWILIGGNATRLSHGNADLYTARGRLVTPGGPTAPEIRLHRIPSPDARPYVTVIGPDGAPWFRENGAQKISRITTSGEVTEFSDGLTPGCRPLSIVAYDGDLWFSEYEASQIGRITVDGCATEYLIPGEICGARAIIAAPDGRLFFRP